MFLLCRGRAASSRLLWRRRSDASRCVRWRRRGVGAAINRAPAASGAARPPCGATCPPLFCFSCLAVPLSARHLTLRRPAMDGSMELGELHRTIQLRSPGLNALSLRRYQTARILHASLHRWLD